jgi:REP-associated tyrosine transposase
MRDVCADFRAALREFNGEPDHVHLLVNLPPTMTISRLGNSRKGVPSRRLRQEFPEPSRHYWQATRRWSGSHVAGSVGGAPITVLRHYIEQQNRPSQPAHPGRLHHRPEGRHTGCPLGSLVRC